MEQDIYLTIENYLNDELSAAEKTAFENQLSVDKILKDKVALYKETNQFLGNRFSKDRAQFLENIKAVSKASFAQKEETKPKVIPLQSRYYWLVAASIAIVMGIFVFDSDPTFEEYYQSENAYFNERGSVETDLVQAENYFNQKKYTEALPYFEKVILQKKSAEIDYFYGLSLLETNQLSKATSVFKTIQQGNSLYKNKAIWNLALIQLKEGNFENCKSLLKEIPEDDENYEKVQKLLNELE